MLLNFVRLVHLAEDTLKICHDWLNFRMIWISNVYIRPFLQRGAVMKYLKKYSLCFFCFSFFCKHVSDVVHVFSYWNVRFVRPYYKKVKEKQHSKLRLQRNQRLGRSGINNFLLQNQKVSENVNMIKLGLVWEKKLCHHNYFIETMENSKFRGTIFDIHL